MSHPNAITVESIFRSQEGICKEIAERRDLRSKILTLATILVYASAVYGFTMGIRHSFSQALSSAAKVPVLFFATLLICLPSLHFVGLLLGSKVRFSQSLAVLLLGIAISSVLLSAFAPISLFFLVTGSRYNFMMIMHVLVFSFCGAAGLGSIRKNLERLRKAISDDGNTRSESLLQVWMVLYMFVGTQMAYALAPFVGTEESEFLLLREPEGNFYTYLFDLILDSLTLGW